MAPYFSSWFLVHIQHYFSTVPVPLVAVAAIAELHPSGDQTQLPPDEHQHPQSLYRCNNQGKKMINGRLTHWFISLGMLE